MKLKIVTSKLFLAIVACAFSVVSTNDYSSYNDTSHGDHASRFKKDLEDRVRRSALALPKLEFRRYVDESEATQKSRRSLNVHLKTTGQVNNNFKKHNDLIVIHIMRDKTAPSEYAQPTIYKNIFPHYLVPNLRTSSRFRDNIVFILGYILQSPNSRLTSEQYQSLEIIYNAIKRRQVHTYNLLPVLTRIENKPKAAQFRNVMVALSKNLPLHLACAANFFVSQIDLRRFDSQSVFANSTEDLNFFTEISNKDVHYGNSHSAKDELGAYDEKSRITEAILGPLFVKLFKSLSEHNLIISQPLFACILRSLPNFDGDPIFNEYIRFIAEIAWERKIPNWNEKKFIPRGNDVRELMTTMTDKICSDVHVSYDIKQSLWYIRDHFLRSGENTVSQSAHEAYMITHNGIDINLLVSLITPKEFSSHAIRLKVQLIHYVVSHRVIVQNILSGMNRYGYTSPKELLLAFLTRLRTRLPEEHVEIRRSVSSLLSILLLKRQAWNISPPSKGSVTLWTLFETINDSQTNPKIARLVQIIFEDLLQKVTIWQYIQNIELPGKSECYSTEICLFIMLQKLVSSLPANSLTPATYERIRELIVMIEVHEGGISEESNNGTFPGHWIGLDEARTTEKSEVSDHTLTSPSYVWPTTGRPYITTTAGTTSKKPQVSDHMTSGWTYVTAATEIPSKKPSVHDYRTDKPYVTITTETTSKKPSVHDYTTTVQSYTTGTTSKKPLVHDYTTVKPHVTTETTTVKSYTTATTGTTSKKPSVYGYTTVKPHVTTTTETISKKPSMHDYTTTVKSYTTATTGTTSKKPSVHGYTTVKPHVTTTTETTSKKPSVHDYTTVKTYTTATTSTTTKQPSGGDYTTTHQPHLMTIVHDYTTTSRPYVTAPTETTSKKPSVHDYTTLKPSTSPTIVINPDDSLLPPSVNPEESIQVAVPDSETAFIESPQINNNYVSTHVVIIPSIVCLQEKPSAENPHDKCYKDLTRITQPLIKIFGQNYIQVLLGNEWRVHYPTRISLLVALLEKLESNSKITTNVQVLTIIKKYKVALRFIAPQVLLPLIIDYQKLDTKIVWSTFDSKNSSETYIRSTRPHGKGGNAIVLPLVNPKIWLLIVNVQKPFEDILPDLPANDSYAIKLKPLTTLFTTGEIYELLGSSWSPLQYPNRGALLISVLRTLLKSETVQSNTQLYELVKNYLQAILRPSLYIHLPHTYLNTVIHRYHVIWSKHQPSEQQTTYKPTDESTFGHTLRQNISVILQTVKPEKSIHVEVSESGVATINPSGKPDSANSVTIPSLVCLQEEARVDNLQDECDKGLNQITQPLIETFGKNYIQVILGNDWKNRYPTRISLIVALLKRAEKNPKITTQTHLVTIIKKYEVAYQFITSYVFLPLLIDYKSLNTPIVWSMYDSENPSNADFRSVRPAELGTNVISFPLVNPKMWLLPVDVQYPFASLLPTLPKNDPYEIQLRPLITLFETSKIFKLLGSSWNPSQYPNRGVLFVSVLHILLKLDTVKSDTQLYHLVQNYLAAVEGPSIYAHIPQAYIKTAAHRYHEVWTIDQSHPLKPHNLHKPIDINTTKHTYTVVTYQNVQLFPKSVNPELSIHVEVSESGPPIIKSSKSPDSPNLVTLPSVVCLQAKPSDNNPYDKCIEDLIGITQPLIKIFGKNYIQVMLGNNWSERYPTRLSFLVALLKNAEKNSKIAKQTELLQLIKRYNDGLRFFASYVLLPLLADYKDLSGSVVWSTYDSANPSETNIGSTRPHGKGGNVIVLPIVNPKIWLLTVDVKKPFDDLFPDLPANDSYATKLKPLINLFKTDEIRTMLGSNWNPSQYPNRGALFISVLHILLNLETVRSNTQLYQLVQNYKKAVEGPTFYVHIPQSYIKEVVHRHEITFTVEGSHETVKLPTAGYNFTSKTTTKTIYESHKIVHEKPSHKNITKIIITSTEPVLVPSINLERTIHVIVSESGIPSIVESSNTSDSRNDVIVPSVVCLQEKPSAENSQYNCDKNLIPIAQPLIETFGQNYIQVILGNDWKARYPTRISFLVALLKNAEKNEKIAKQTELLRVIKRYELAFGFVSSYILLPLIIGSQKLTSEVVWSTYDSKNPSASNIGGNRPHGLGENVTTFPLVNPKFWLLPVDIEHPFITLLPNLPANDPYAIKLQPLRILFEKGTIRELLGSDWSPSLYPNRGALFTSVLHILLKHETVRSNTQLYELIRNYLKAVEVPTRYMHISHTYITTVNHQYNVNYGSHETTQKPIHYVHDWDETSIEFYSKIIANRTAPVLPPSVIPGRSIYVKVSESGTVSIESSETPNSPNAVTLPSVDCLQDKPSDENPQGRCEKDLIRITQPLIKIFGEKYIEAILGNSWKVRYPTRISLLVALLTEAEKDLKIKAQTELVRIIKSYKLAFEFVASYVILPMIVDSEHFNTLTVWSSYDSANPSESKIGSNRPDRLGTNVITLPLVNPKIWLLPVDVHHPFAYLLPKLPQDDPYFIKLQPLFTLFGARRIYELLGSSWNPSQYPNRGALFISVLRTLSELEVVQSDRKLYNLVYNYLMAFELPALYVHVPHTYIKTIFHQYNVTFVKDRYVEDIKIPDNIPLPPAINPKQTIQVIIPESGSPVVESLISLRRRSKVAIVIPSVTCLQGAWDAEEDEDADSDGCNTVLEFRLIEPLINVFGEEYIKELLGDEREHYPTRISFLAGILRSAVKNAKVLSDPKLFKTVKAYKEALEVAAPYIFLPLLANYQKLVTEVVWLTYNYENPWETHMSRHRNEVVDNATVTLPIVNPKVWMLPVNIHHPFSGFLPNLPRTDPYEEKIAPLRSLLNLEKLRNLTGKSWDPSQYPNRGAFFVSAMHTLLKLGPTRLNADLNNIVRSYYMAIEIPALYVHIPRTYINHVMKKASGTWRIDLVGLMVALGEWKTNEERKLWSALEVWLTDDNLLKQLKISMPSMTTSKGTLLMIIMKKALTSTKIHLAADIKLALQTFKNRIQTTGAGAEFIGWVWVTRYIETTIIDIGNVFTTVVPIERVPDKDRGAYHALIKYFADNPKLLTTEGFHVQQYHTYGAFLRAYLNYLSYKSDISEEAKKNIDLVIPYVRYTGPGAIKMPLAKRQRAT